MAKQIAPEHVVGRDRLIAQLWKTIERESVVFTAERRIGKTTVMRKMEAEPVAGSIVLYADLEKVDTPVRFVETLLTDLKKHLTRRAKFTQWFGDFVEAIGGTEVGGIIKIPQRDAKDWQTVLEKSLSCACSNQPESRLIFLWDEIPYMLQKINALERESGSNDHSALAILDCLRAMRNQNANLRMILTGSIGLHHVLADLRGNQFASQPANDMAKFDIGPLTLEHATELARDLLAREEIQCSSRDNVAEQLVRLTDCVPFYIHRVVSKLTMLEGSITPSIVESVVYKCLSDHSDPWEMEHFRERLKIYYRLTIQNTRGAQLETASVAKVLLNNLAAASGPQSIDQCFADLKSKLPIEDRDLVIDLLKSLTYDHYLERDQNGRYSFRFPLVRRWWVMAEGLNR